ncbi:Ku protein [Nitrosovibrio sp. Nv17]|uniref:non-homologous end joining protein Ku n=1 Tax=Nitrosovibrio sp. Nv17 TaxID=1855339 RepID=UPI00090890BF|nr:Ku protein [Nitrosovibrio sp. Nv17]SFW21280.1 DNA end-binding protein Ku [Nitrosovibrio sp. Nv17]
MKTKPAAAAGSRPLWKGAISFGLVHIPVALHSATSEEALDFDWLDRRTMDPVGYRRINKRTGKEVGREHIVKGIEHEAGRYVVLEQEEIEAAYPEATQTIDIEAFVPGEEISFVYLARPYFVVPIHKGAKVYALLREALRDSGRVGLARVVIQTRQHLAALVPSGPAMVLNLLRWGSEIHDPGKLEVPEQGAAAAGVTARELKMARQLIAEMSEPWNPGDYHDAFRERILELVRRKAEQGDIRAVSPQVPSTSEAPGGGAQIVDLAELLRKSLKKGPGQEGKAPVSTRRPAGKGEGRATTSSGRASARRSG